ncbi:MAG: nitrophenyl compound nitroreductase subunit ArsF family protein [Bacteroidales bacterium]|nr:nitrophenyl compound nitroreductase subunit ArsF family protein [Bacteroidales bacterium]
MKKRIIIFLMAVIAAVSFSAVAVSGNQKSKTTNKTVVAQSHPVQVIYFHSKQRCLTCMAIERETKALVEGELASLVKSGKVSFKVVDISRGSGQKLAAKYRVTFSSLFIVTNGEKGEKVEDLTRFAFGNARNNAEKFRSEVKAKVMKAIK